MEAGSQEGRLCPGGSTRVPYSVRWAHPSVMGCCAPGHILITTRRAGQSPVGVRTSEGCTLWPPQCNWAAFGKEAEYKTLR